MNRLSLLLTGLAVFCAAGAPLLAQNGAGWGTVKGRVVWGSSELPKRTPLDEFIKTKGNDKDYCLSKGSVLDEKYIVNPKNKGLKWTFVWLINDDPKDKTPLPVHPDLKKMEADVVIDQPICMFIPHATGLREGQNLVAKNSAAVAHNFKWTGNQNNKNAGGNVQLPAGAEFKIKGLIADPRFPVQIECSIHPWMKGWVRVFDNPYFAITDDDGNFEIKNAPAGKYRVVAWIGTGGFVGGAKGRTGQEITIKAGGTAETGELKFTPPAE